MVVLHRDRPGSDVLNASLIELSGIGPALAEKLEARGLHRVLDMVWCLPRRYDDVRHVSSIVQVIAQRPIDERIVVRGFIKSVRFVRRGRRGFIDMRIRDQDDRVAMVIRFFNAFSSQVKRYEKNAEIILSGKYSIRGNAHELANPDVLQLKNAAGIVLVTTEGIIPRYPTIPGVPGKTFAKACQDAVRRSIGLLAEPFPKALIQKQGLATLADCLRALHAPPADLPVEEVIELNEGRSNWHRRLAYQELFFLGMTIARKRHKQGGQKAMACKPLDEDDLENVYPYTLTDAQNRARIQIHDDLIQKHPMNRLLQGDVGSGKTAVAFAAMLQAVRSGCQVALMAPTSILAEQHGVTIGDWAKKLDIRVELLTASTPVKARRYILLHLAAGEIDILIGTHSLLSDEIVYKSLGLVIIDEQHRFGVAQRSMLRDKSAGESVSHLLVMTATPIPRTLALSAYGHLNCSIIDEMPPGRSPARTQVLQGHAGRTRCYQALRRRIENGERAYIVCPLVGPSEDESRDHWKHVEGVGREVAHWFGEEKVGIVHGQLPLDERQGAIEHLKNGEIQVLVSTTVIEVGVDIPEVNIIIIEDADHFGLAALHQLRGRVGRGGGACECILLTGERVSEDGKDRLDVMVKTNDGFEIAEEDLRIRGPGDVLGIRQAGIPTLRFGDLRMHQRLLEEARADAESMIEQDPLLADSEHFEIKRIVDLQASNAHAFGEFGG